MRKVLFSVLAALAAVPALAQSNIERLASGVVVQHITRGTGDSPDATSEVTVHYQGMLRDGTVFDSSIQRGQPISFSLSRVIPCWTEGVQRMRVGGQVRLTCPANTAYGARGVPGSIPPNSELTFDVQLRGIGESN